MNTRNTLFRVALASTLLALLAVSVAAARQRPSEQSKMMELVTLTGEVTAVDAAGGRVTMRGPLGGEVSGTVSPEVKNLAQVKVGDLVTVAYYESLAVSVKRKGAATTLFNSASGCTTPSGCATSTGAPSRSWSTRTSSSS